MERVTISSKFQVVIPKAIREQLKLVAGQKEPAIAYRYRSDFLSVRPPHELQARQEDRL